jgi:uncharacterized protein YjiS (DUF1127 family)
MAHYHTTETYGATERLLASFGVVLERLAARRAHNRIYRETLRELASLNDRDLADLGFHRGMLKRIAKDAANKKVAL